MIPAPTRNRHIFAWVWLILVLVASVGTGIVWSMAPGKLGFSGPPSSEMQGFLLWLSWWVGLPMLALLQVTALVMARWHPVGAAWMASFTLALFLLAIRRIIAA